MKISEQWLREWVNPPITTVQLAEQLNLAGIEVASFSPVAGVFTGVIVGRIIEAVPHPNATRLQLCQVDIGAQAPLAIVCGAVNARAGIQVAVAQIGAVLPNAMTIKEVKLRGVLSQGMLCSSQELGLLIPSEGIIELPNEAPLGQDLRVYLQLDDHCLDIHLTPNRGDCLSIQGLAREIAALTEQALIKPEKPTPAVTHSDQYPTHILSQEDCPRYLGRVIRGINPQAVIPRWMSERLSRSGFRTIHPVVDSLNYVLLELGQPMHAFDLAQIQGALTVRRAQKGEMLTLLDGKTVTLDEKTLVVADEKQVQALAGIFGGQSSAVHESTTDIFLESAFFSPTAISGRARRYGLQTESAYRFERGVDPQLAQPALERATQLILEIAGGQAGPVFEPQPARLAMPPTILLRRQRVEKLLGIPFTPVQIEGYLQRLGMQTHYLESDSAWQVMSPLWRFDLKQEVDLIEELARLHGYQSIPAVQPTAQLAFSPLSASRQAREAIQSFLVARDYQEVITYSFVESTWQSHFAEQNEALKLVNPISSDLAVMRASLWPGLVQAACHNQKRQQTRIRFFETGLCFQWQDGHIQQVPHLGLLVTGTVLPEQWGPSSKETADFFALKADISALFKQLGQLNAIQFIKGKHPALHPGQTAQIVYTGNRIGYIGRLHPQYQAQFDLAEPLYLVEIALDGLVNIQPHQFQTFSKFPRVRRDLSFWLDRNIEAAAVLEQAKLTGGAWLDDLYLFDVYEDKKHAALQRSFALALIWQHPERTLTDKETDQSFEKVIASLQTHFAIKLREAE